MVSILARGLDEPQWLWHLSRAIMFVWSRFFRLQQFSWRASNGFKRGPLAAWPVVSCAVEFNETVAKEKTLLHWQNKIARLTTTPCIVCRSHIPVFTPTEKGRQRVESDADWRWCAERRNLGDPVAARGSYYLSINTKRGKNPSEAQCSIRRAFGEAVDWLHHGAGDLDRAPWKVFNYK